MWGWFQLMRPPNLPSVPGDPVAGFLLASLAPVHATVQVPAHLTGVLLPAVSALLLYMGGLILNDVADYDEDLADRPQRPLPSGRVSRRGATIGGLGLGLMAMALSALCSPTCLAVSVVLWTLILAYNFVTKRCLVLGCINMGLCRGVSLLLGASALGFAPLLSTPVLLGVACVTLYISTVTFLAARETEEIAFGLLRWLPLCPLWLMGALFVQLDSATLLTRLLALGCVTWVGWQCRSLSGTPAPQILGKAIGGLIRGLLLMQAAFCATVSGPGTVAAAVLLLLIPVSTLLAKRFYAT
ncbi:MAG: UbiA family prenyltransferase [Planctomycetes bacterium]|nr:UbiA family prenyltransferase [Planctomycetota bacterium]